MATPDKELLKKYKEKMYTAIQTSAEDPEKGHIDADKYLCDLLNGLGYEEITDLFDNVRRNY